MDSRTATVVLHPWFKNHKGLAHVLLRDPEASLEEGVGLARAIDLDVLDKVIVPLSDPKPSMLFGTGKVAELNEQLQELQTELVIVNSSLSPVQQRNLENAWNCKVIDRTALILEIFGARARTHEGKLQVELAALNYQKSRLVRSWTHLERQRGGFGFLGGPGESQIEIDRRLIRDRIAKLRKQLEQVTRTRELHRKVRRETPFPVVALVGYTNAGKSTLFNRLTGADVLSMDKLFATLDPTMRAMNLSSGTKIILSDTVGFVSDLPTELVAAFRATLEEVLEANLLLHIRDIAHPDSQAQKEDVEKILKSLFHSDALPDNVIEIANKSDLLDAEQEVAMHGKNMLALSAITGEGVSDAMRAIEQRLEALFFVQVGYTLHLNEGKRLAWLHEHGIIMEQQIEDEIIHVKVQLSPDDVRRFEALLTATH